MLTITDLSSEKCLAAAELRDVRGGSFVSPVLPVSFSSVFNTPRIDAGVHELNQGQSVAIDQSGSLGGFNIADSNQHQFGIAGQVAF